MKRLIEESKRLLQEIDNVDRMVTDLQLTLEAANKPSQGMASENLEEKTFSYSS